MIISESFSNTSRNVQIQKNNDHIKVSADLQKSDKSYNSNQVFEYKGGHLENREGNFFLKLINKVKYQKIPKNIFRTFKYDYKENIKKTWTEKNPDYNYYFFNDDECLNMIKNNFSLEVYETYMSLSNGAPKADLWRCCVLYLYGGVYVDIDCECENSIDDVVKDYDFVVPVDTDRARYALFNAFIASTPRNNILYHLINKIIYNVKNKNYIESHDYKGDAFSASGPGALGEAFSELLNNPFRTLYSECVMKLQIPRFTKINIGRQNYNVFYLKKNINDKKLLFYYDNSGYNWKYNFNVDEIDDCYVIKKINDKENKGWNNELEVACHNSSSKTITTTFYFGEYNYHVGSSDNNNKIIEIYHDEYEKIINNKEFLKVDFSFMLNINEHNYFPKYSDLFTFKLIEVTKNILKLEIIRTDENSGWGLDLDISIYYSSLIIDTLVDYNDLINTNVIVYDFFDYLKSNVIHIENINSSINYSNEIIPNSSKIKFSITNYEHFLPIYTIINIVIHNTNYPEEQNINLLWHNQFPEYVSFKNEIIIKSQICQNEKDNIISSYTLKPIYKNEYFKVEKKKENKVAVVCSFPYHYEMFGFLITYNRNLDFFANFKMDNFQYIDFYENTYNIKFLSIECFNHKNYDFIIDHTDDDIQNLNLPSDKVIIIEHEYYHRSKDINKKRILSLNKLNFDKRPIILPVAIYINKNEKQQLLKKEYKLNIIYFNNKKAFFKVNNIDNKLNDILLNTCKKYDINFYYRPSNSNENLIKILSLNNRINLVDIEHLRTNELMNCYKKSHYSIIGNEQIKHSGSITSSLSCGCQLLVSHQRSKSINSSSMICIEDINELDINIDYDKIYEDVENNILKNNKLLYESINDIYEDLF